MSNGECIHKNKICQYGFATSYGFRGLGLYEVCADCYKLLWWGDDLQCNTEQEVEHNKRQLEIAIEKL